MSENYILDDNKNPIPCDDIIKWGKWFNDVDKRGVDQTVLDNCRVSTVFLGIDHSFDFDATPVLFETMIFGGEHDGYQDRCCTWDEAKAMHKKAIEYVQENNQPTNGRSEG